jgi:flagellar hook-associated protein FlgK
MMGFSIGLSGLSVNQRLIDLTGQNITNAGTPGYHRQVGNLVPIAYGQQVGGGVILQGINRYTDSLVDTAVTQNTSDLQSITSQLGNMNQLQTYLASGSGSLDTLLEQFFGQLSQLSAHPDDPAQRSVVLKSASSVTNQINSLAGNFAQVQQGLDSQLQQTVTQVNTLTSQIADLNGQIQSATAQGLTVNDLLDQRDQLINQLAGYVDVRTLDQGLGQRTVLAGGVPVVVGNQTIPLQFSHDASNNAVISTTGSIQTPVNVTGGQVAGLLATRNNTLPDYQNRLNNLAQQLAQGLDSIQSTGIPLSGPFTQLVGQRPVTSATVPLAQATPGVPPKGGTLTVSITNQATGQRTTSQITIDPSTQSLQGIAAAFSSIPNLQGVVNTQTNTLTLIAKPGYAFDFAGRLSTQPDTSAITGTASTQISGNYTGSTNDNYTFTVVGSGTVGVTPNLTLQVKNGSGNVIGSYNIGQGYAPGSDLPAINGVVVKLGAGTVNNNDTFGVQVTAQPDTSGILTALGLNTFLTGSQAGNLAVRPDLLANPQLLAASRTGQAGDSSNVQRFVQLRDTPLLNNGTQTLGQAYAGMVGNAGALTQQLSQTQTAKQVLGRQLVAQQQSVEGVDVNEELVRLTQYQQSFQAASQYINVVNSTLNDLFNIIR